MHIMPPTILGTYIFCIRLSYIYSKNHKFQFLVCISYIHISIMYKQILSNVFCKYFCNGKKVSFYSYRGSIFCIKCMIWYIDSKLFDLGPSSNNDFFRFHLIYTFTALSFIHLYFKQRLGC